MKFEKVINAYAVIDRISGEDMPLSVSYKLFKVKKMLQPQIDFRNERVNSVISKFDAKHMPDGSLKFKSKKDGEKCAEELNKVYSEIMQIDVDFGDTAKQTIRVDSNINLSIGEIDALSDFFNFEE